MKYRSEKEYPEALVEWGWKYHHLGIPTKMKRPGEKYLAQYKFYVSGFSACPFGVEWMRFEQDSPIHILIQTVPHLAFVVEDLDRELAVRNLNLIGEPGSPSDGIRVAMIEYNGTPIEMMEYEQ
jgi:hypothetical protein